jgi:hypothetical protein
MKMKFQDGSLIAIDHIGVRIEGLRVRPSCLRYEGSNGIGVVRPGSPGRITMRTYLRLPNGEEVLVRDFSSQERDERPIIEIGRATWCAIRDEKFLAAYNYSLEEQCRSRIRASNYGFRRPEYLIDVPGSL